MSKLIIMKGLPACGKSTRAKEIVEESGNTVRINKDLLRTMLHFDRFSPKNEDKTQQASKQLARFFLGLGVNVIIDDTNLNPKTLDSYKSIAKECGVNIQYEDMTDIPVSVCVERDNLREKKVGHAVIQRMAMQYLHHMKGKDFIVSDLDGTLCDIEHRRKYVRDGSKDWNTFFNLIPKDTLRYDVYANILANKALFNANLILVSARPERCRADTEKWLYDNAIEYDMLFMRPDNDTRDDTIIKSEIVDKYLSHINIMTWFDDRPKVIRAIMKKGISVIDVGNGEEF